MRRSCSTTRRRPGGRARTLDAPYRANLGPHVLYSDGAMWGWLKERALLPPSTGIPFTGCAALGRRDPSDAAALADPLDAQAARPPRAGRRVLPRLGHAPAGERTAEWLSALAGVYTFHHDPG